MKKKTSVFAIIIAIFFSILLFPFILVCGSGSAVVFSLESVVRPGREEEIYETFVNHGGIDILYDVFTDEVEKQEETELFLFDLEVESLFPKEQFAGMIGEIYHAVLKEEEYTPDFSYQKNILKEYATNEFESSVEEEIGTMIQEQYGAVFEEFSEEEKQQLIKQAEEALRKQFEEDLERVLQITLSEAEVQIRESIHSIYEGEEYQNIKEIEEEYQFSLTDRTELCYYLKLTGYVMLAVTAFFILLLLLSHLFRPSGFFTAGVFTLLTAAGMYLVSIGMNTALIRLIDEAWKEENIAEKIQKLALVLSEEVITWCSSGFEYTGKIFAGAAVLFVLTGILLLVIKRKQAEAELTSGLET